MPERPDISPLLEAARNYRDRLEKELHEIVIANAIMAGEIPSPTFHEEKLVRFLCDRFTESDLSNISTDESGNAGAILPGGGEEGKRKRILVAAHVDKVWDASVDHTVTVGADSLTGPGVGDNSLGVAALASLPALLEKLDIRLNADLILLGTAQSFGRGDLRGLRFFLKNSKLPIDAAICVEGMQIERLSYSCLGMLRGEITVEVPSIGPAHGPRSAGAIDPLTKIVDRILAIERPERPVTDILMGSIEAGSTWNVPPQTATLRFEIRGEQADVVERVYQQIEEIVREIDASRDAAAQLQVISRHQPGDLGFDHPLVRTAHQIKTSLGVESAVEPSISELSALLDEGIPGLTLGLTRGEHRHTRKETVEIAPIFTGLAQVVAMLEFLDGYLMKEDS